VGKDELVIGDRQRKECRGGGWHFNGDATKEKIEVFPEVPMRLSRSERPPAVSGRLLRISATVQQHAGNIPIIALLGAIVALNRD
jgi:hypothetical protein